MLMTETEAPLRLPLDVVRHIVDHASETCPDECCGYLRLADGEAVEAHRATNTSDTSILYEVDGASLFAMVQLRDEGEEVCVYHSHPFSSPIPSWIDVTQAFYPDWTYLIVGLHAGDDRQDAELRAWRIVDEEVVERRIEFG